MAAESPSGNADDECAVAVEAAMGVALDHCTDDAALRRALGSVLGVEPDPDCATALDEGLDEATCTDSRGLRQWVLCRAHDLLKNQRMSFQEAMEQAWNEAKDGCDVDGAVV